METVPLHRRIEVIALRPDLTRAEIEQIAGDTIRAGCLALCVAGSRVELAAHLLEDSDVRTCALVGFPFGSSETDVKRFEVEAAVDAGAREVEVVLNHGWLKDGNDRSLLRELRDLREAAEERPIKAAIEMALLGPDEIARAAALVVEAECQFLVTATGCAARPTSEEDIRALREIAPEIGLIAVGGINDRAVAEDMIRAGANRVGLLDLRPFLETPEGEAREPQS